MLIPTSKKKENLTDYKENLMMAGLYGDTETPLMEKATDRAEEIAQFLERMKIKQEQNGVCDETTISENGRHQCPILWYVGF